MPLSFLQIATLLFTYAVFGYVGFRISKRFKRPVTLVTWIVLILATVGAGFVLQGAILIGGFEFNIYLNNVLQAIGVGIIIGIAIREIRLRLKTEPAA